MTLHSCKAHGKTFCFRCLLVTIGFPIEHFIWEKAPILRNVTVMLGL